MLQPHIIPSFSPNPQAYHMVLSLPPSLPSPSLSSPKFIGRPSKSPNRARHPAPRNFSEHAHHTEHQKTTGTHQKLPSTTSANHLPLPKCHRSQNLLEPKTMPSTAQHTAKERRKAGTHHLVTHEPITSPANAQLYQNNTAVPAIPVPHLGTPPRQVIRVPWLSS